MKHIAAILAVVIAVLAPSSNWTRAAAASWDADPVWHDGLVEKAVYKASRVVYDKPREYDAVFFTNKEQHDRKTLTKAEKSTDTFEVWKFNQVEVIPTPNYDYKYVTTSHLTVAAMQLTRAESSSQEFCGTSFKQYKAIRAEAGGPTGLLQYFGFSYMPEAGTKTGMAEAGVPVDAVPLWMRGFDFEAKGDRFLKLLPSQKSNRPTDYLTLDALAHYAGEEGQAHKIELMVGGKVIGTYWMAKDPAKRHVMLKYEGIDGQRYELKSVERVDYWSRKE